jgi:hypothetical protein
MRNYRTTLTSISTANPAVFTLVDHGLTVGDRIRLTTSNTLPTGLSVDKDYWVVYQGLTTSTFQLSVSNGGTPLAVTAAGTGDYYFHKMDNGIRTLQQSFR